MKKPKSVTVSIPAPNMRIIKLDLVGTSPLMISRFPQKVLDMMEAQQREGSVAKSRRKREPKDFEALYEQSMYCCGTKAPKQAGRSSDGWNGIHAAAFRNAAISACRVAGFVMTRAKLAVFIVADGYDADGKTPLVRITKGKPEMDISPVRNATGVADLRPRAIWKEWEATLTVRYDADMLNETDIANLFTRAGMQVGVCEGRPDSKQSNGLGYGLFEIKNGGGK